MTTSHHPHRPHRNPSHNQGYVIFATAPRLWAFLPLLTPNRVYSPHSRVEPFSELGRHWRALSKEMRSTLSLTPFVNCPPNAYLNFTLTQLTSPHSLHSRHPSPSSWSISTLHLEGLFGFAVLALWYVLLTGIHPHSFFPISSSGLC